MGQLVFESPEHLLNSLPVLVPDLSTQPIIDAIIDACTRAGAPYPQTIGIIIGDPDWSASTILAPDREHVGIFTSQHFTRFWANHPEYLRAILAHEVGHIYHKHVWNPTLKDNPQTAHQAEFEADAFAAGLGMAKDLAGALKMMRRFSKPEDAKASKSHPPVRERIRRLNKAAAAWAGVSEPGELTLQKAA